MTQGSIPLVDVFCMRHLVFQIHGPSLASRSRVSEAKMSYNIDATQARAHSRAAKASAWIACRCVALLLSLYLSENIRRIVETHTCLTAAEAICFLFRTKAGFAPGRGETCRYSSHAKMPHDALVEVGLAVRYGVCKALRDRIC